MKTLAKIELGIKCCASTNVDKCTGCPYEGFSGRTGCRTQLFKDTQDYLKAIRKSAARIETMVKQLEAAQPKWISVEERLPEPYRKVLTIREGFSETGRYIYGLDSTTLWIDNTLVWNGDLKTWKNSVTHWMPLPEPPKEDV